MGWVDADLREWSPEETARLQAIGETAAGANFDLYMGLCARKQFSAPQRKAWRAVNVRISSVFKKR